MLRKPPDILITTPESLYLMMTSQAREILTGVEAVIVDEIHAVAQSKRGAHLALTLERLSHLRHRRGRRATRSGSGSRPPSGRSSGSPSFLVGPRRECEIVNAGIRKELDLEIVVPVEDMTEPGGPIAPAGDGQVDGRPVARRIDPGPIESSLDPAANPRSIWPAIYPELLKLVREHTSTIIFVNNRRGAERLAKRLNELHNEEPARGAAGDASTTRPSGRPEPPQDERSVRGDRPGPPRLARPRGAAGGRGAAQVRPAPLPRRHLARSSSGSTWAPSTS